MIWKKCTRHFERLLSHQLIILKSGNYYTYLPHYSQMSRWLECWHWEVFLYGRISANKFQRNKKIAILQLLMEKTVHLGSSHSWAESVRLEMNGAFLTSLVGAGWPHLNPQMTVSPREGSSVTARFLMPRMELSALRGVSLLCTTLPPLLNWSSVKPLILITSF